ncbi:MAG TPA: ornithine carbamoyltransferase [Eubacteriaceae bacterium]|nr:ornithine carbamoyltransferase [Eubacteriaceae bacterium]
MNISLKGRSLLTLKDYSKEEIEYLLKLAKELKESKRRGKTGERLKGKNVVLLFEKTSTRTRCAFEVAVYDEGGNVTNLTNSQMGGKESIEDTAKVLGRFYDGIQFRGFAQETVDLLAEHSGVPVWNGLTDLYHPTQVLADFLTIQETVEKPLEQVRFVYVGDGRNNVANSLMIGAAKMGMDFVVVSPKALFPKESFVDEVKTFCAHSGGSLTVTESIDQGVDGADVIYTDVWVSMGEEDQMEERIRLLSPYQVNQALMNKTHNDQAVFLHCLPAFHDQNTTTAQKVREEYNIEEMEVTDQVFRSEQSKVFDEAENRMHTIKAVICATI